MRRWWKRRGSNSETVDNPARIRPPLREFVYLDDVSLRSLLASQKGELTDQVTDLLSQADEAELASTVGVSSPVLKAEVISRYQATTSQGTQTSRKAVSQSLFKELMELEWIDIALRTQTDPSGAGSVDDLVASGRAVAADNLRRGALVEVEVELVADPVFRFSTIASELAELARDFPEVLDQPGARDGMAMLVPGNRFLQRFLVGLVPLRAKATSHVIVDVNGIEHVVPAVEANALGLPSQPLSIVGVTEQSSYWRDVRRVLFANSRFTMLCRVARDGLRTSWEPVKLAEVLKEILPTFPDMFTDLGRTELSDPSALAPPPPIAAAVQGFIDRVERAGAPGLTPAGIAAARQAVAAPTMQPSGTVAGQNEAFRRVIALLQAHGCTLGSDAWLELVRNAREQAGLGLFDQPQPPDIPTAGVGGQRAAHERLIDTEVIAIYW